MRETKKYPEGCTSGWRHEIIPCYLAKSLMSAKHAGNSWRLDFYHKTTKKRLLTYLSSHDRNHHSRTLSFSSINNSFIAHWENIHWHNIWKEKKKSRLWHENRTIWWHEYCNSESLSFDIHLDQLPQPWHSLIFNTFNCWTILILNRRVSEMY